MAKYVVFELNSEPGAVHIECVKSIETMKPITRVPTRNPYVLGVMNLRGVVIPVISLRKRLGMPAAPSNSATRIIVIAHGIGEVGVVVDAAHNVMEIDDGALQPPVDGGFDVRFVRAMTHLGQRILSVLDMESLLATPT